MLYASRSNASILPSVMPKGIYRVKKFRRLAVCCLLTSIIIGYFLYGVFLFFVNSYISVAAQDSNDDHVILRKLLSEEKSKANCSRPAIEQFPKPFLSQNQRINGAVGLHIFISLYMFLGLAILCDEYFVPSLNCISQALKISNDVAGATFMAAGSSAPELATSFIGVFIAQDDIGLSTVVGSAVYNIVFVTAVCGLFAGREIRLNPWPLYRDSFFYLVSILLMAYAIWDDLVSWLEASIMLLTYVVYVIFMCYNETLEKKLSLCYQFLICRIPSDESETCCLAHNHQDPASPISDDFHVSYEAEKPKEYTWFQAIIDVFSAPIVFCAKITVPDCRENKPKPMVYIATFILSCVWISVFSYVLVWMVTIIGFTFGISDTVMGLTFLAAGVSLPDALSSLVVAKEGEGDMAVSNAVGSNIFDILICMALPWFVKTAIIKPGYLVPVESNGLLFLTFTLISTVFGLIILIKLNKWKLDKRLGVLLLIWYFAFEIFASMYELGIFSKIKPLPMCSSNY